MGQTQRADYQCVNRVYGKGKIVLQNFYSSFVCVHALITNVFVIVSQVKKNWKSPIKTDFLRRALSFASVLSLSSFSKSSAFSHAFYLPRSYRPIKSKKNYFHSFSEQAVSPGVNIWPERVTFSIGFLNPQKSVSDSRLQDTMAVQQQDSSERGSYLGAAQ